MAYIWNDYKWSNKYVVSDEFISPYLEVWMSDNAIIPVNIYLRLADFLIPNGYIAAEIKLVEKYKNDCKYQEFANIILHLVALNDRKKGFTALDVLADVIDDEIANEKYGSKIRHQYNLLSYTQKQKLTLHIAKYIYADEKECQLDSAFKALFKSVNIYEEESTKKIYIYINDIKTADKQCLANLCLFFFKDIFLDVKILWAGEHFGVINVCETMIIDEMALI